jgi:signal transduction histidine kinase
MPFMVIESLVLYAVMVFVLAQGFFVLTRKNYGMLERILFMLQAVFCAVWILAFILRFMADTVELSTLFMKTAYVASAGVVCSWTATMFSSGFFKKVGVWTTIILFAFTTFYSITVLMPTGALVVEAGVMPDRSVIYGRGEIYLLIYFAVHCFLMVVAGIVNIIKAPSRLERNRYAYIFVALVLCVAINSVAVIILPANGIFWLYWVGPTSLAALAMIFIMSAFKFRLFSFSFRQKDRLDGGVAMDASLSVMSGADFMKSVAKVVDDIKSASRVSLAAVQIFVGDKSVAIGDEAICLEKDILKTAVLMRRYFATDELDNSSQMYKILLDRNITAIASIEFAEKGVFGAVLIGNSSPILYTEKEISTLTAIANIIAIAYSKSEFARENLELRKIDEAKDELLDVASHNLRTPLTIVRGYIELILGDKTTPVSGKHLGYLRSADNETIRMLRIIDDFLTLSRIQTDRLTINRAPTDLREVVVDELISLQELVAGRGKNLRFSAGDGNYVVNIDAIKIRQVISNLVDNAVFYSGDGKDIFIKLSADPAGVTVEVEDRGIGVPEEERGKLFKKFSRASNAKYYRPDGTGTGLYMVKRIVEDHGGRVTYRPLQQGSVFGFFLPR